MTANPIAAGHGSSQIWNRSEGLSPRVERLRREYFSFREREGLTNEVRPYTTGTAWDVVFAPHNWGVVPEMIPFFDAFSDSLLAMAEVVDLPAGFFDEPLVLRRALFFRAILEKHLPVRILEGELVAGFNFNTAPSRCLTRREAARWQRLERTYRQGLKTCNDLGIGNCGAIPGHLIPDYPAVLSRGFSGIAAEARQRRAAADDTEKKAFYDAIVVCCEATRTFAARYADLADELAAAERDPVRRGELENLGRMCRRVPWEPAGSFHEAVQSVWFTHMLVMACEGYPGAGLSHGRIDQYLFPFYRDDLDAGRLDRDAAREILRCFWIKHNYAYDYQGRVGNNQGINSGFGQLLTIGGIGADGGDASNPLTWLILDVIEEMNLLEPKPNIRLHRKTPDNLLRRVAKLVASAQGSPFLMNFDEASIEGLAWQGLPAGRLWDYAPVGCLENTLQGDDRSGTVDVNLNLAKPVELVFGRGVDPASGLRLGPDTGDPTGFKSFEAFYGAYKVQLLAIAEKLIGVNDVADALRASLEPTPYLSAIVGGCLDSGRDVTAAGARYNFITVEGVAFATAVDSLLAVKALVFDEKRLGMAALAKALEANFEGFEKERRMLRNRPPKFGNDDGADRLAADLNRFWTEEVFRKKSPTGKRYRGGYLSWNYWISFAPSTAATPDGRPRGTFLSNGICPVNGMDRQGPTAVIRSIGRVGLRSAPNGASHTLSLSPSLLRDEEHVERLAALLRAYAHEGGTALQINVIDPDTLRKAQQRPEEYRNLLVRITGYNAYFVTLGKEIQDEIIAREAHKL